MHVTVYYIARQAGHYTQNIDTAQYHSLGMMLLYHTHRGFPNWGGAPAAPFAPRVCHVLRSDLMAVWLFASTSCHGLDSIAWCPIIVTCKCCNILYILRVMAFLDLRATRTGHKSVRVTAQT